MKDLPSSSWPLVHRGAAPRAIVARSCAHPGLGHRVEGLLGLTVTGSEAQENVGSMLRHSQTVAGAGDALRTDSQKVGPQELLGPSHYFLSL